MELIIETHLTSAMKTTGLLIREEASHLLPNGVAILRVWDARTGQVLQLEYRRRPRPIIRGENWQRFIGNCEVGATIRLYAYDGSNAANYEIVVN
ncbi:hypothetical protein DITRI_Ditri14bG0118300 [Diplodiscus trichospermus]